MYSRAVNYPFNTISKLSIKFHHKFRAIVKIADMADMAVTSNGITPSYNRVNLLLILGGMTPVVCSK